MSDREKFLAARGALRDADATTPESDKSKKRRAMAGCKEDGFRKQAGYKDEASCNSRVMSGDTAFMLEVMDAPE